jgi:hypothetical protein
LAKMLISELTKYFSEFEQVPTQDLPIIGADCSHTFDGTRYKVSCQSSLTTLELEWSELLDRKQIYWPGFPAGEKTYDLTTVICPCRSGWISIDGTRISGDVHTEPTRDGHLSSSAFLAFAETWVGPMVKNP